MVRKNLGFLIVIFVLLAVLCWSQIKLSQRPAIDNDEGIYLTTFLLVSKGHPVYKETFFSQPPFFLLSVYPIFVMMGETLAAARVAVGLWSLTGLLALIWIGWELDKKWLGLLAAFLLYLIPHYANQTMILQSDVIAISFSLLALASFISFCKRKHIAYFITSAIFLNFAFWTKLDFTLLPALAVGVVCHFRKQALWLFSIFALVSLLVFLICIVPFGIKEMYVDVIRLRLQASTLPQSPYRLMDLLLPDLLLSLLVAVALPFMLSVTRWRQPFLEIITIWYGTILLSLIVYRPLFDHHLAILAVPAALFSAHILYDVLARTNPTTLSAGATIILIIILGSRLQMVNKSSGSQPTASQIQASTCITRHTVTGDLIVSDEAILMPVANRLPPPPLVDISYIRILSGNLTENRFVAILARYHPKMVVSWNGRLATFPHLNNLLRGYNKISCQGESKHQNMYLRRD